MTKATAKNIVDVQPIEPQDTNVVTFPTTTMERTGETIAAEINLIKEQAQRTFLMFSVQIGKRLTEAKAVLAHGEWGNWLEKSVDYSQSTANNMMKLYKEYGNHFDLESGEVKSQALGNLSYTAAVALLQLPEDGRMTFLEHNEVEGMSSRQINEAVKQQKKAEDELAKAQEELKEMEALKEQVKAHEEELSSKMAELSNKETEFATNKAATEETIAKLQDDLKKAQTTGDTKEIEKSKKDLEKANQKLESLNKTNEKKTEEVKKLKEQLEKAKADLEQKPKEVKVEVVPDAVNQELEDLRKQITKMQRENNKDELAFSIHFKTLTDTFGLLLSSLLAIDNADQKAKYVKAIQTTLDTFKAKV